MDIRRRAERTSETASSDYFTGDVTAERLFEAPDPARTAAVRVTFQPGARTAWHTHPLGQTLYIVEGTGLVQRECGDIETVGVGDVVMFAPGEKHWHGASRDSMMTHIAIHERKDGNHVEWLEKVSDDQYEGRG
ncbi:cupin domain-containing protein [Fulvimarina sp. 2208YS6-2-32]|uniref:Cupin domain-containing protein n=1 Tax=Fulvimarina uroteuthidis TaxID=3098149 RepID=A0ABU5HYJ4_9HYPH|nr:cupin domain-containing protein [Fulvimarina sp. 2208YS6-2-32]MDY8108196.1 cupin domain-containing protein [Fulvimarina sp. 2208YS6-2-32]